METRLLHRKGAGHLSRQFIVRASNNKAMPPMAFTQNITIKFLVFLVAYLITVDNK